jgi:protein-ribulosamine 3-kinase
MGQATGRVLRTFEQNNQMDLSYHFSSRSGSISENHYDHIINRICFIKVTQNEQGKAMVSGEFASMKLLHDTAQNLTPAPIAWGTYAADPNIHFFLCEFVDMTNENILNPQELGRGLADLHMKGLSPNGKYGFSVPTLQGTIPQYTEWSDSWEEFFTKSIKKVFELELKSQGSDPEILVLEDAIVTKVIPRLLRPLETGGRKIEPRLIHGDIWDGNVSTNKATNLPVIFDAACIYAHNESKPLFTRI